MECDWYEKVGINPRTKLIQVRCNNNFDACGVQFLKNLDPTTLSCGPPLLARQITGYLKSYTTTDSAHPYRAQAFLVFCECCDLRT